MTFSFTKELHKKRASRHHYLKMAYRSLKLNHINDVHMYGDSAAREQMMIEELEKFLKQEDIGNKQI